MSLYVIDLQNEGDYTLDTERLIKASEAVLIQHKQPEGTGLCVVVGDDEAIIVLNEAHRGISTPTDVLSFPSDIPPELMEDAPYLGDIIIAYPYTQAQATQHQHDMDDTLCLLVVHGCLHLLGYDHDTPENKAVMWEVQAQILMQLGIDTNIVPALES